MLATLPDLKAMARVTGTADDAALAAFLAAADAAVKAWLRWNPEQTTTAAYRDGSGTPELVFFTGRAVSLTVSEVRLDTANGGYGQVPDSFGSTTVLTAGTDYFHDPATGVLVRNSSAGNAGHFAFPPAHPAGSVQWSGLGRRAAVAWPAYPKGCVKVTYTNGYAAGAVPADLAYAVARLATRMSASGRLGGLMTGESLTGYSYSLAGPPSGADALRVLMGDAELTGLLAPYREMTVATGVR
jgi:hypothetical protein